MLGVKELFEKASIEMRGPVPWLTPVPETASGVYVITLLQPLAVSIEKLSEPQRSRWECWTGNNLHRKSDKAASPDPAILSTRVWPPQPASRWARGETAR